jgi:uncharacterized protein
VSRDSVYIRFYEELNDFLPEESRKKEIRAPFPEGATVKSLIEELGVPHTEVDLILVNGRSEDFSYRIADSDRISVYPVFESFDVSSVSKVRSRPLRVTRFVLDVHLGKLAKSLRLLGFDTLYSNTLDDGTISKIARDQGRIILTRDRGLLKRRIVSHGYLVRSKESDEQLAEVIARFDLENRIAPFSMCMECNVPLVRIPGERIAGRVPEKVFEKYDRFSECPICGRIFWQGTHWEHMQARIESVRAKITKLVSEKRLR